MLKKAQIKVPLSRNPDWEDFFSCTYQMYQLFSKKMGTKPSNLYMKLHTSYSGIILRNTKKQFSLTLGKEPKSVLCY